MHNNLPAALQLSGATADPQLAQLVAAASPGQKEALLRALREAHAAGQREAEARTGRIIAQVVAPLLGVRQPTTAEQVRINSATEASDMRDSSNNALT